MGKTYFIICFLSAILITSCENQKQDVVTAKKYNICLILDGTDMVANQNCVPKISTEEILNLATLIAENGEGTLYLSYIDDQCANNDIAIFDWDYKKPAPPAHKSTYMTMAAYTKLITKYKADSTSYQNMLNKALANFAVGCNAILARAYSDEVAKKGKGSDIFGALNRAQKLLFASQSRDNFSDIIMVSDMVDNIGTKLEEIPESTELLVVSTNKIDEKSILISREFVTLPQVEKYIFR